MLPSIQSERKAIEMPSESSNLRDQSYGDSNRTSQTHQSRHAAPRAPVSPKVSRTSVIVSPFLPSPTVPSSKSKRKKALTSALYYSECFMRGIKPIDADMAALDAKGMHNKWWVESRYGKKRRAKHERSNQDTAEIARAEKRRKRSYETVSSWSSTSESEVPPPPQTDPDNPAVSEDDSTVSPLSLARGTLAADLRSITPCPGTVWKRLEEIKNKLLSNLEMNGGEVENPEFLSYVDALNSFYRSTGADVRWSENCPNSSALNLDGKWRSLSKPTYTECKGRNFRGEYMYSLGRMSFDMFRPSGLTCSIQGVFNTIRVDETQRKRPFFVPRRLREDRNARRGATALRNYDIVVTFTIEANQTRTGNTPRPNSDEYEIKRPIHCTITNHGYVVPDPTVPNRLSIWFSGGSMQISDRNIDMQEWREVFDKSLLPKRDMREYASVLAAKVLLGATLSDGMEEDGSMHYKLKRPIGGHGSVFCDILYMDESLRIMRGHHGSTLVLSRLVTLDDAFADVNNSR